MIGELVLTPLLPWPVIAAFAIVVMGLSLLGLKRGAAGALWRLGAGVLLVAALLDPRLVRKDRESQSDVVVALVDRSASQTVGQRTERTDKALAHLQEQLKRFSETELRIATVGDAVPNAAAGTGGEGTLMMRGLRQALGNVPRQRLAGVVIVGDGQVHDISAGAVRALP